MAIGLFQMVFNKKHCFYTCQKTACQGFFATHPTEASFPDLIPQKSSTDTRRWPLVIARISTTNRPSVVPEKYPSLGWNAKLSQRHTVYEKHLDIFFLREYKNIVFEKLVFCILRLALLFRRYASPYTKTDYGGYT